MKELVVGKGELVISSGEKSWKIIKYYEKNEEINLNQKYRIPLNYLKPI